MTILLKGGQGRSDEETESTGLTSLVLVAMIVLGVVAFLLFKR